jgi:hypothetical protein
VNIRSERSDLWEGRIFHPSGAIRDVGPAKCQSRMALRGAALTHFYKLSRGRAVILQGRASREPLANVGSTERARSRVAFGQKQFSRGVDSNDKDLLWLLAPTKFEIAALEDATRPRIFQNAEPLA